MFVAHNFGTSKQFSDLRQRGGEQNSPFWKILIKYLDKAGVQPENCFFTNVLMGLQPIKATGSMPKGQEFREQCEEFFLRQIEIVAPRAVVTLGEAARSAIRKLQLSVPTGHLMHPSAWQFRTRETQKERCRAQADKLQSFLSGLN